MGFVYDESNIILARENQRLSSEAGLLQNAIATIFSQKAQREFARILGDLPTEVEPFPVSPNED